MIACSVPRQRGAVLYTALILLVAVMVLAVTMFGVSRTNLQIVRNDQSEQQRIALAQRAVEQVLSDPNNFASPTAAINVANTADMQVNVSNRVCLRFATATGYSAVTGTAPIDTVWSFTVTVIDPLTGGSTVMTQGTKLRMLAGNCP